MGTPRLICLLSAFVFLGCIAVHAQTLKWAVGNEGSTMFGDDRMLIDPSGNVVLSGMMNATTDLDPGPGVLNLTGTTYVQKLDSNGLLVWAISSPLRVKDMALDTLGNIYLAGWYSDSVDADPGPGVHMLPAGYGHAVIKLTAAAGFVAAAPFQSSLYQIMVEESGTVVVAGTYGGVVDLDPSPAVVNPPTYAGSNLFVVRLTPSLSFDWYYAPEYITGSPVPRGLLRDASGGYLIAGDTYGTADMDPGPGAVPIGISTEGACTVVRLTATGIFDWAKGMAMTTSFGGAALTGMELLPSGAFVLGGILDGTFDMDPGPGMVVLSSALDGSAFMACYDPSGNYLWAHAIETRCTPFAFTSNGKGDLFLSGLAEETIDLDFSTSFQDTVPVTPNDAFLIKVNALGHYIWGGTIASASSDPITGLAASPDGSIAIMGLFTSALDYDLGAPAYGFPTAVGYGAFIARYQDDPCSLYLVMDSLQPITCSIPLGHAEVSAFGGALPYSYTWSTSPPTPSPVVTFPTGGFYSISVTDVAGCTLDRSVWVSSPDTVTGPELQAIASPGWVRVGKPNYHWVHGFSNTCTTQTGTFEVIVDPGLSLASVVPPPTSVSGDTLRWLFTDLNYDSTGLHPRLDLREGSYADGDTAYLQVRIHPLAGDVAPLNNEMTVPLYIVNSCDPNYKVVMPVGECPQHYVRKDEPLIYTLHFQNVGTGIAYDVRVADTLDTELDLSTFRVLEQSHPQWTELVDGHILNFHFDGINLSDTVSDEPGSHGHVIFEIRPKPGLADGTEVHNSCAIYFDTNPAVVTNTVMNTLVTTIPACATIGLPEPDADASTLVCFPNPAHDHVTVKAPSQPLVTQSDGRRRHLPWIKSGDYWTADLSQVPAGLYLIHVPGERGVVRLVRE